MEASCYVLAYLEVFVESYQLSNNTIQKQPADQKEAGDSGIKLPAHKIRKKKLRPYAQRLKFSNYVALYIFDPFDMCDSKLDKHLYFALYVYDSISLQINACKRQQLMSTPLNVIETSISFYGRNIIFPNFHFQIFRKGSIQVKKSTGKNKPRSQARLDQQNKDFKQLSLTVLSRPISNHFQALNLAHTTLLLSGN